EYGLCTSSFLSSVPTPVLARHHQRSQGPLGGIVGGIQTGTIKKGKQVGTLPAKMILQTAVGGIPNGSQQQTIQLGFYPSRGRPQPVPRELSLVIAVSQGQAFFQYGFHLQREAGCRCRGHCCHIPA